MRASCSALNSTWVPPPRPPEAQPFARGAPPRKSDVLAYFGVGAREFKFGAKSSLCDIFGMHSGKRVRFSAPVRDWSSFAGNLVMPAEWQVVDAPGTGERVAQAALADPPGSPTSSACKIPLEHREGVLIV